MSTQAKSSRITSAILRKMKQGGEKIACLTAYDASFASLLEAAGVDVILVGDSLGMVIQGHSTTVPVTLDHMVYHCQAVARGSSRALLMADMPFMSYTSTEQAMRSAARLMQEGGAQMVKLEGDARQVDVVRKLAEHGVPVCAHLGLQPQLIHKLGGYKVQGRDHQQADAMLRDAAMLEDAGADALLLECVPEPLAAEISANLGIPVIGIGASPACDGQILVSYDILGISAGRIPKFAKDFLSGRDGLVEAIAAYVREVKSGAFPTSDHVFH